MFNWLMLVGSNGTSDAYKKINNIDIPSVILGIIIGIIISVLVAFIIVIFHNSNKTQKNEYDNKTDKKSD